MNMVTLDEFKEFLEKKFRWHYDIDFYGNVAEQGAKVTVHFDESLPTPDFRCVGRAYLIAPGFNQIAQTRGHEYFNDARGAIAQEVPAWYPLPASGWHKLNPNAYCEKAKGQSTCLDFVLPLESNEMSWKPFGDVAFSDIAEGYCYKYVKNIAAGINELETGVDLDKIPGGQEDDLTKRGRIIINSIDMYFSVEITWVLQQGKQSTLIYRSWGIPQRYVSSDLI